MSIIDVFHASYEQLSLEHQALLKKEILEEIQSEFILIHDIEGSYPISLKKALDWIGKEVSDNQYKQTKADFRGRFLSNNPFFEEATSFEDSGMMVLNKIVDTTTRETEIYFSIKGFEYWCMTQKTPKANAIKSYFSNIINNYHQKIKEENKNLKTENENLKKNNNLDFVTKKFQMFSEQIFRVDSELKKLKEIYEMKESEKGKVYFIHEVGSNIGFKIGFTRRELEERIAELQTGNIKELKVHKCISYNDCQKFENYLHECFANKHIRGEWYNITLEEVDNIVGFLKS